MFINLVQIFEVVMMSVMTQYDCLSYQASPLYAQTDFYTATLQFKICSVGLLIHHHVWYSHIGWKMHLRNQLRMCMLRTLSSAVKRYEVCSD